MRPFRPDAPAGAGVVGAGAGGGEAGTPDHSGPRGGGGEGGGAGGAGGRDSAVSGQSPTSQGRDAGCGATDGRGRAATCRVVADGPPRVGAATPDRVGSPARRSAICLMCSNAVLVAPTVARWRAAALAALVAVSAFADFAAFVAFAVAFFADAALAVVAVAVVAFAEVAVAFFAVVFFAGVADITFAAVRARPGAARGPVRDARPTVGVGLGDAGAIFLAGGRLFWLDRVVGRASSADIPGCLLVDRQLEPDRHAR